MTFPSMKLNFIHPLFSCVRATSHSCSSALRVYRLAHFGMCLSIGSVLSHPLRFLFHIASMTRFRIVFPLPLTVFGADSIKIGQAPSLPALGYQRFVFTMPIVSQRIHLLAVVLNVFLLRSIGSIGVFLAESRIVLRDFCLILLTPEALVLG